MKIEELITESQVTDEGVLSALGTGIGAVGKGIGAISGAYQGAKDQFNKGHAAARAHVGGHMPAKPKDTSARDAEFQKLTGKPAPGAQAAPAQQGGAPAANPQDIAAQIKAKEAELADLQNQLKQAQKQPPKDLAPPPQSQPGIGSSSGGNNAAATATEPAQTGAAAPTNTASKQPAPGERVEPTMDPAVQAKIDAAPHGYDGATGKPNAAPAPTQGADNQVAQQQQQKIDPNKAAELKNRLKNKQGATSADSGYKSSRVGVPVQKMTGADAQGNPQYRTVRESVDFYSRFLGQKL
jgi:hypothetical protein